ncbi:hypothetical protein HK096_007576 [Nowakowskiella sp. JEL0078]|nr:hypothetical protein HK096_007576 [Nowakowskiella sp. JEL0078]
MEVDPEAIIATNNEEFKAAAKWFRDNKESLSNGQKLEGFGLAMQGSVGDNNQKKPGVFDVIGGMKWKAWEALKGMTKEEAQSKLVEFVGKLKE